MATKNFSDWRDEVAKYVQFASTYQSLVDAEVKEVIRDFCRDTGIWKKTLARVTTVVNQADYPMTVPTTDGKAEICYFDNVKYKENGADDDQFRNLEPFTQEEKDEHENGAWSFHTAPDPYKFYADVDKTLILYPIPTVASTDGLLIRVVVRPTDDATKVPDFLYIEHKKSIAIGVAGAMCNMPNKPWSDAALGKDLDNQYLARRDEALQMVKMGYTKKKMEAKFPFFGGSRSQSWNWKP